MAQIDAKNVLQRLAINLNVSSDTDLAKALGVAKQTIATWRKRKKVPLDHIVEVAVKHNLSVDAILFNEDNALDLSSEQKLANLVSVYQKNSADRALAEDILDALNEELWLEDRGLNDETLSIIFSAMREVSSLIPNGIYDRNLHQKELELGATHYLASYYEIMHIAKKNSQKKN